MKSIFNESEKTELIERINKLNPELKPLWGIMSVSRMLTHCTVTLKLAFGEITPELNEKFLQIGKQVKNRVFETEMFSKNIPTTKEFLVPDNNDFHNNKTILIDYINKYSLTDVNDTKMAPHPYFDDMSVTEWGMLIWKHTNHHLTQFGV